MSKWKRWGRIWAGALAALLVGWAAIAFGIWLTNVAINYLSPPTFSMLLYVTGFGLLWMVAFFCVGFAMAFICAFCWHKVEPIEQHYNWSIVLSIVFFLPVAALGCGAFFVLIFAFPLFVSGWRRGRVSQARLPYFFGLTNDYERDENES